MKRQIVALSAAALLGGGLAAPQAASADTAEPTAVRNVKVSSSKGCVRVKWAMPPQDSGDTFGVIIRSPDWAETHRIETWKLKTKKCDLKGGKYNVLVKQYGGVWVRSVVMVPKPD